jgi:hypothetical protein
MWYGQKASFRRLKDRFFYKSIGPIATLDRKLAMILRQAAVRMLNCMSLSRCIAHYCRHAITGR